MKAAVERVKESPHHATSGEVRVPHKKKVYFYIGSFARNFHIGFDPNYELIKNT